MIKYLKYILLVFGSLGVLLVSFFFFQNKHDLSTYSEFGDKLDYDYLSSNCIGTKDNYYYPCFLKHYETYNSKVSLTGRSLGLKKAFDFLDEDKAKSKIENKDIVYSLNYLEINNIAITNVENHYYGFDFVRPSYPEQVKRFKEKAAEFSQNLIFGLEGVDGLQKLPAPSAKELTARFEYLKETFFALKSE